MIENIKNHKNNSTTKIYCSVITLSDTRKDFKNDESGNYIVEIIENNYDLISRSIIPDEEEELRDVIEESIGIANLIITTGGTGLSQRDITVETLEPLFDKRLDGFGELFRQLSYEKIGASAILSRATAGVYKKTLIIALPGSLNAVKTALDLVIDELPHLVHHATH